jgi:hypothetical protein
MCTLILSQNLIANIIIKQSFLNHKERFSSTLLKYLKQGINVNKSVAFENLLVNAILQLRVEK